MEFATITEILMMIAFGFSWPSSIFKTIKSKSTKGKSMLFLILIDFGYVCGIVSKITSIIVTNDDKSLVAIALIFYIINFAMVTADLALYFHYRSIEKMREQIANDLDINNEDTEEEASEE